MPKINRGSTIKLSIRLSSRARKQIKNSAKLLGISSAGVILFELTRLIKSPPTLSEMADIESRITLERNHFVLSVNEKISKKVNYMAENYNMKKNVLIGYIVSEYFENLEDQKNAEDTEPKKLMVQVNEALKKKMMDYSENNYVPLNAIVSYSILQGPYEGLPKFEEPKTTQFFTNIPSYIGEIVKDEAEERNIREHFYTSLCIYKQFMRPEGRFYK